MSRMSMYSRRDLEHLGEGVGNLICLAIPWRCEPVRRLALGWESDWSSNSYFYNGRHKSRGLHKQLVVVRVTF